jgi:hypothetical protein
MKDQQHDPSMTCRASSIKHCLMNPHAKGKLKLPLLNVMLFSMLTGLSTQEIVNLRYRQLASETDQEMGNRKGSRFLFPETLGGTDGE